MATNHRIVFIFLSLLLSVFSAYAQSGKVQQISPEGDTIILEAIPLTLVTASLETDHNLLQGLKKRLQHDPEIDVFDSVFKDKSAFLEQQKNKFDLEKENYSVRDVNNSLSEWGSYEKMVNEWKELVNNHLAIIEKDLYTLGTLNKVWELTSKEARKLAAPQSVMSSIAVMLDRINKDERTLTGMQNDILRRQNKISKVMLSINEVMSANKDIKKQLQSDILALDNPPVWQAVDSSFSSNVLKEYFSKAYHDNVRGVSIFFESNTKTVYFHLFLFLLIWIAFYFLQKQSVISTDEENKHELQKAQTVVSRHGLSALVISMFLSVWLYPELNSTIADFLQLAYLVIAIIFFPVYLNKKLKPILYAILLLFFLDKLQIFLPAELLFSRLILFLKAFLGAWILFEIIKKKGFVSGELEKNKMGLVLLLTRLFFVFLALSVLGNLVGNLSLSILLCNAVVNAILTLIIVLLVVIMVNRSFIILLRTEFMRRSNYINNHWQLVEKRLKMTVFVVAFFLWLKSIINSLSLLDPLNEWLGKIVQTSWKVGDTTIEFGGIIGFFLIIILTVVFIRVVKTLLEEELFPRVKFPRGVPGAVSMIVGYVLAAYGIYLALTVGGVNLGKFGLIAGALGVGIGFGLQNIVANFIAGLILAFERPIQVGDTIEAGTVFGDVKTIGVRACTIRTFDGSEVMIPNGNLISNDVINWTLSDRKKRRDIFVSVAYGSNPHQVLDLIKKVAEGHPNVLHVPAPWALFDGFGDSALNFRVRIWTALDVGLTTKSEVAIGIYDALAEAGIEIPFPQQDMHVKSFDPTIQTTQLPAILKTKTKNK